MQPCSVCPRNYSPIGACGPTPCDTLFIGERPNENDNRVKQIFTSNAGEELDDTYLRLAGMRRSEVRVTNAVRCWAESNRTPSDKEIAVCGAHHLKSELARTEPDVLVLMGGSACKLAGNQVRLETHHGRPQKVKDFAGVGWDGWVWPTYHPARGMREGSAMSALLEDFELLGKWLRKKWSPPTPAIIKKSYHLLAPTPLVLDRFRIARSYKPIAIDTEKHGNIPFSMQFSQKPGEGFMILAEHKDFIVKHLAKWIYSCEVILHNSPGDLNLLAQLGVTVKHFRDTMQEAFHQGSLPQGLKPLTYRLTGATMRSWEDVVRPDSLVLAIEWLVEALNIAEADLSYFISTKLKTRKCVNCGAGSRSDSCRKCGGQLKQIVKEEIKPSPTETAIRRIIRCSTNPEYDTWEKVSELWEKEGGYLEVHREHIEKRIGEMPILGIGNCKLADAAEYAIGDADYTGQVAVKLKERREDGRYEIDEDDGDSI